MGFGGGGANAVFCFVNAADGVGETARADKVAGAGVASWIGDIWGTGVVWATGVILGRRFHCTTVPPMWKCISSCVKVLSTGFGTA
jgi:hypothetical protein